MLPSPFLLYVTASIPPQNDPVTSLIGLNVMKLCVTGADKPDNDPVTPFSICDRIVFPHNRTRHPFCYM